MNKHYIIPMTDLKQPELNLFKFFDCTLNEYFLLQIKLKQ